MATARPARRKYKRGELILQDCMPFAKCVASPFHDTVCNNCMMGNLPLIQCSCQMVYYCNADCKLMDWNVGHSMECSSRCYKNYCRADPEDCHKILAFRIYAQLQLDPDCATRSVTLHDGTTMCPQDIVDKLKSRRKQEETLLLAHNMVTQLKKLDHVDLDFDYMLGLISLFENLYPISGGFQYGRVGWGIYVQLSVFRHACKPNTHFDNVGPSLHLRAVIDIKDGAKPVINYLLAAKDRIVRLKNLWNGHNFLCYCPLCDSESDADVDYQKLAEEMEKIRLASLNSPTGPDWREVYLAKEAVVEMLRKMCYPYDPRITIVIATVLDIGIKIGVFKPMLKKMQEEAREHLKMTFGENSEKFRSFTQTSTSYFGKKKPRKR